MKRMLIALAAVIAAALIATVTIGSTTALLGGEFEVIGKPVLTMTGPSADAFAAA